MTPDAKTAAHTHTHTRTQTHTHIHTLTLTHTHTHSRLSLILTCSHPKIFATYDTVKFIDHSVTLTP